MELPVKDGWVARTRALLFPLAERLEETGPARLAIPHTFKPRLTFREAVVAVAGAFLRIFFGSLLFAVWGAYSLAAWTAIRSYIWRLAVLLPLLVIFLLSFALLLVTVSALVRALLPKRALAAAGSLATQSGK
jgi:hypothetical protein